MRHDRDCQESYWLPVKKCPNGVDWKTDTHLTKDRWKGCYPCCNKVKLETETGTVFGTNEPDGGLLQNCAVVEQNSTGGGYFLNDLDCTLDRRCSFCSVPVQPMFVLRGMDNITGIDTRYHYMIDDWKWRGPTGNYLKWENLSWAENSIGNLSIFKFSTRLATGTVQYPTGLATLEFSKGTGVISTKHVKLSRVRITCKVPNTYTTLRCRTIVK